MGKLNKVRLLGELVEVVESVQGEEEFCEQLQHRLMDFRRTGFRDMEPLMFGSKDQADLVGQPLERFRFAEAIAYLDQNMRLDRDLYQLAEESLKRFKSQRAVMYTRATEAQNKFYDLLDQLVEGEHCSNMNVVTGAQRVARAVRGTKMSAPSRQSDDYAPPHGENVQRDNAPDQVFGGQAVRPHAIPHTVHHPLGTDPQRGGDPTGQLAER
ncbi:uncharacterized protein LOC117581422 isoform X2 [Drosophila guanche]|uniref:uncharacterized protein LOC117581422 isoform X2 n=1 Tax=Drosophila guanche TaxID=7266 RepID=UPI00147143E2|nr:uncharacterized protein LOC117581422 isoform X2 [Drosophila guanche]